MQEDIDKAYGYISHDLWTSSQQLEIDAGGGGGKFVFDRNTLSYTCLKGCAYMQNKSMANYADILINTLRDDYNIPVTVISMDVSMIDAMCGLNLKELKTEMAEKDAGKARWLRNSCCELISDTRATELSTKRLNGTERVSWVEHQQLWVYHMVVQRYKIPLGSAAFADGRVLSQAFVDDYVMSYAPKATSDDAIRQFYSLKRLRHVLQLGANELEMFYASKLAEIRRKGNSDMEAHQTKAHAFYGPAIKLNKLLNRLDGDWAGKLKAVVAAADGEQAPGGGFEYTLDALKKAMSVWASADITDAEYTDILNRLAFDRRTDNSYRLRPKLLKALGVGSGSGGSGGKGDKSNTVASGHMERLMKAAFGIQLVAGSNRGTRVLDFSLYTRLARLKALFGVYSFVDDEDPLDDPLEPK